MLRFTCPGCATVIETAAAGAGSRVHCPKCNQVLQVPSAGPPAFMPASPTLRMPPPLATPENRDWYYLRKGQRNGPVTMAQLQELANTEQLHENDLIWRTGMAEWKPAHTVAEVFPPGFDWAGTAARAGEFWNRCLFHPKRAFTADLQTLPVTDRERSRLLGDGIGEESVQRYLAWRHSILLVILGPTVLSAILGTVKMSAHFQQASAFGVFANLIHILSLFALPAATIVAVVFWSKLKLSRTALLYGWIASFLVPIVIALFPLDWLIDLQSAASEDERKGQKIGLALAGFLFGLYYFFMFLPIVISPVPGVVRACLRIKTLLPESIVPGWFLVAAAIVYSLITLPIFILVSKFTGNFLLILGTLLMVGSPLVYVWYARIFIRPLITVEDRKELRRVQVIAAVIMGSSFLLLVLFALTKKVPLSEQIVGTEMYLLGFSSDSSFFQPWNWKIIQFLIEYFSRSLFITALAADLFMRLNISVWVNARQFAKTPRATAYDKLINELEVVMGTPAPQAPPQSGKPPFIPGNPPGS